VAEFIGDTNFLAGRVVSVEESSTVLQIGKEQVAAPASLSELRPRQKVTLVIRPEKLEIVHAEAAKTPSKGAVQLHGKVRETVFVGTDTRIRVKLSNGPEVNVLVRNLPDDVDYKRGEAVVLSYQPGDTRLLGG
jgi:spermidine/putrescine transport system ATP-binding protein